MTTSLTILILASALGLSLAMSFAWAIAERTGQSGWIDATWSFAVGAGGVFAALVPLSGAPDTSARQIIVAGLAALWSLRLGLHIAGRTRGAGDDPRYARLREEWGKDAPRRLFWFLQIQAAAGLPLVIAILLAARRPGDLGLGDALGVLVMLAAILGETVADRQLSHFRSAPANKGKVCDVGLWGLSRHPNYFFEWLGWVAYAVIAIDLSGAYPYGWLALAAPALMYWLLVHVSGIPLLEAHMLRSRGEAFRAYQARVSAFWPVSFRSLSGSRR